MVGERERGAVGGGGLKKKALSACHAPFLGSACQYTLKS